MIAGISITDTVVAVFWMCVGGVFGLFAAALAIAAGKGNEYTGTVESVEVDGPTGPIYASIKFTRGASLYEGDGVAVEVVRDALKEEYR